MKNKPVAITPGWINIILGLLIAAEAAFLFWGMRFVNPACKRIISYADNDESRFYAYVPGAKTLLACLHLPVYNPVWWVIGFAFLWGLFEWRVPNETKSRLRPGIMASLGLLLFLVSAMFAAALVIPMARAAEQMNSRYPEAIVATRMTNLDRLMIGLEKAVKENDLPMADDLAHTAMGAASDLANTGAAAPTLLTSTAQPRIDRLRADLDLMYSSMRKTWLAARRRHPEQIGGPLQKFRETYAQVKKEAVSQSGKTE